MSDWQKVQSRRAAGKPHFWYSSANAIWVVWTPMTKSWGIFNSSNTRLMPGRSYHYKTDTAAMRAADKMIKKDTMKNKTETPAEGKQ